VSAPGAFSEGGRRVEEGWKKGGGGVEEGWRRGGRGGHATQSRPATGRSSSPADDRSLAGRPEPGPEPAASPAGAAINAE